MNTTTAKILHSPVSYYGKLFTKDHFIYGSHTTLPVQLTGMSFFWSQWSDKYYHPRYVDEMVDEWGCEIVRIAYGVDDTGTPCEGSYEEQAHRIIQAAIARGIYVIVDWHSHGAEHNPTAAKQFFTNIARTYGSYDHLIFELYNEPIHTTWIAIKNYVTPLITAIREYSDNLIVIGSPTWSQDVDLASLDPIAADNIAYTLHFYAGTHKQALREKAEVALRNGIALFVTEWGGVSADGNGAFDYASTMEWMNWLDTHQLSSCNWAINDKEETSSVFHTDDTLTDTGLLMKELICARTQHAPWRRV